MDNNSLYSYYVYENKAHITKCNITSESEITIPSEIDGYPVIGFDSDSFRNCDRLTKLTIPDSVRYFPDSVFLECPTLSEIIVDENNPCYASEDGALFDKEKTKLLKYPSGNPRTRYRIPDSVTEIEKVAFDSACRLTDFEVGENNPCFTSEDGVLFDKKGDFLVRYPAGNMRTGYGVPDTVRGLNILAFWGAKHLTDISIPKSVVYVVSGDIYECDCLTEIKLDPDNPRYEVVDGVLIDMARGATACCPPNNPLTDYRVPECVTTISPCSFSNCRNLKSVVIPKRTESISIESFENCTALESVSILTSDVSISRNAFNNCIALKDVWFAGTKQQWEEAIDWYGNKCLEKATVHFDCDPDSVTEGMKS